MKKVFDGKIYDTDKATKKADWEHLTPDSPYYCKDNVYVTSKNNWFLHSFQHSSADGTTYEVIETINPLNKEQMFEWLYNRNFADLIELYFSDMIEEA